MAKYKKMMPPRNTTIRGQDHLLAYITPEEAQMLIANGGSGEPGPMGIPAFAEDDGDDDVGGSVGGGIGGDDVGTSGGDWGGGGDPGSYGGGDGGSVNDFGSFRGSSEDEDASLQQDIAAAAAMASGVQGLSDYSFDRGSLGGLLEAQTYRDLLSGQGFNLGGFSPLANRQAIIEAQRAVMGVDPYQTALGQIPGRMEQAKAGYGLPGIAGAVLGGIGSFTLNRMQKALEAGGRPVFDATGQLKGVFSEGPFGLGEVYTGTPVEGVEGTGYDAGGRDGGSEPIKPVDPVTGQCEEGYIFDEDLQMCRISSGASSGSGVDAGQGFAPGQYARMGLLDVAPTSLPQFQQRYGVGFGTPMDFDVANTAFRRTGAVRRPYPGYSLLT